MGPSARLIQRLNRGVKSPNGRWEFVREHAFGDELRLQRYRLGNGLTVLTLVDRSAPTVSYHTWLRVGSRDEQPGKTGLAHLFEHLMFNETKNHPYGEFDRLMEQAGVEVNAATWTDWTYYYENAPRAALPLLIELEADRMQNLVLRSDQVASEKEVVVNERKLRVDDHVEGTAVEQLYRHSFRRHPYGWPTIGWMNDIRAFTVDDCRRFYRAHYAPNRATVVIVGDFQEQRALSLVQQHYGRLRATRSTRTDRVRPEPAPRSERLVRLQAPTPTAKLLLGYRSPAFSDRQMPALSLASDILFGGRSSRLYRLLCVEKEVSTSIRGSVAPFRDPGLFEVWASLQEGKTPREALTLIDGEIARLASKGPTANELEKAINQTELSFLHGMETAGGKAEQIGFYETVVGNGAAVFERLRALQSVTSDQVKKAVARVLIPSRRTRVEVLPGAA